MASRPPDVDKESQAYLPDFCAAGAIFVVVLVAELIAILLTLASRPTPGTFLTELAKMSLFIQWLALLGAEVLAQRAVLEVEPGLLLAGINKPGCSVPGGFGL